MSRTDTQTSPHGRLVTNSALRFALLAVLVIVPVAVYAGQVGSLTPFVNGEVADANAVNANFTALAIAINDNDTRITTVENLLGASCSPGQFITTITAGGSLTCATP